MRTDNAQRAASASVAKTASRGNTGQVKQVPIGPDGSEFGGIESGTGLYLASGPGVFAQLAWYF